MLVPGVLACERFIIRLTERDKGDCPLGEKNFGFDAHYSV